MKEITKPNLFVVGAPKTGTTALCQYLSEHPNIFVSNPKEPFYWCKDFQSSKPIHKMTCEENYLHLFADADKKQHLAIGEGSTTYLQSHRAIAAILEFNPDAKFIAMLRNPLDVAYGIHGELIRQFLEDEPDFQKAWQLQESRARGENMPGNARMAHQLQYRDVATFYPQIRRLVDIVPESQRKIIIFDDFVADTQRIYNEVLQLLELPNDGRTDFPRVHAAKVFRSQFVGKLYHAPPSIVAPFVSRFRHWFIAQKGVLKNSMSLMASKERPRSPLPDDFKQELKQEFRDDITQLSDLLSRDLTGWLA